MTITSFVIPTILGLLGHYASFSEAVVFIIIIAVVLWLWITSEPWAFNLPEKRRDDK